MQSLISCLFALLLYSGQQYASCVYICPPLVDKTQAAGDHRGEER